MFTRKTILTAGTTVLLALANQGFALAGGHGGHGGGGGGSHNGGHSGSFHGGHSSPSHHPMPAKTMPVKHAGPSMAHQHSHGVTASSFRQPIQLGKSGHHLPNGNHPVLVHKPHPTGNPGHNPSHHPTGSHKWHHKPIWISSGYGNWGYGGYGYGYGGYFPGYGYGCGYGNYGYVSPYYYAPTYPVTYFGGCGTSLCSPYATTAYQFGYPSVASSTVTDAYSPESSVAQDSADFIPPSPEATMTVASH